MRGKVQKAGYNKAIIDIAKNIKLLILDVDGVMTDGSIILDNKGNESKSFHVRDGHGVKMLINAGVKVAIITGRQSKVVARRAKELKIIDVYQKSFNKVIVFKKLAKKYSLSEKEIAFMGDDIVDAPVMARAGLAITVSDADDETKRYAHMITRNRGGRGAVREVTDLILKAKKLWKKMFDEYFKT
jgi:3-deoxy-D-manno-octulosonate 8-phosphate phosphatase (KDO 8-P phosphatase)